MELSEVQKIVIDTILEFNGQNELEQQLETTLETRLFGRGSKLDSLGLVNLIVMVEEKVNDETGIPITLADERAMSQKHSPFRTVQTLSEYIFMLLKEQENV